MRIAFAEWPDGLMPSGSAWEKLAEAVQAASPDILITDHLPFGPWLAGSPRFDAEAAARSVALHAEGVEALASLDLPAVVTTRPVWRNDRLVAEAIVIEGGRVRVLHRKQILPDQEGWREASWFQVAGEGYFTADILGVRVGLLFCTEMMFNEHARRYGSAGAELILVPRATPANSPCLTAAAMAAIVAGTYVVSSSRVGSAGGGPDFGGAGFAYGPTGELIAATSAERPLLAVEIDPGRARRQKCRYPCYLAEALPA